ncbi:MAG: hypothetical protein ACOX4M_10205 [Acetivibrionales bacterium]
MIQLIIHNQVSIINNADKQGNIDGRHGAIGQGYPTWAEMSAKPREIVDEMNK